MFLKDMNVQKIEETPPEKYLTKQAFCYLTADAIKGGENSLKRREG
jgi:hypothetical protein